MDKLDAPTAVDVQASIDRHPLSAYQWAVFALCLVIMVADGFDTASIGFVVPALSQEWGIPKHGFGVAVTASIAGMALGALISGPIADKVGRKPVLVGSIALFAAFTLACAWATSIGALTVARFIAGLGFGAATPTASTLLSESVPSRLRALLLNAMFCGFTLGAALGGFAAAGLIPKFGWQSVFILGGIIPAVLAIVAAVVLPESVRYLARDVSQNARAARVLRRLTAGRESTVSPPTGQAAARAAVSPLKELFTGDMRTGTAMLWLAAFTGNIVFYVVVSWLPAMLKDSGIALAQAAATSALFPLGGAIGTILCGWLMDRMNAHRVVAAAFFSMSVFIFALGRAVGSPDAMTWLTFVAGFCTGSALISMPALATGFYPTSARATGVSSMLALGRFGGIAGTGIAGALLAVGLDTASILGLLAIPGLFAGGAIIFKDRHGAGQPRSKSHGESGSRSPARVA